MNVAALLRDQAIARPDAPAIVDTVKGRARVTTFAELDDRAARAAALLQGAGLRPGDGALVLQPMSAELYVALCAILRLGLVAVVIDPAMGRERLARCCALYPPRAFISSAKGRLLRLVSPAVRRIPHAFVIGPSLPGAVRWSRADGLAPHRGLYPATADTPGLLTFTSGSTGEPKAAVRTHGVLLAQHRALQESLRLRAGESSLTALPIVGLADLACGATCVVPRGDLRRPAAIDPAPIVAQAAAHRVERLVGSPALCEALARHCRERDITLPALRRVYVGGGPVFPRLVGALARMAPRAEVVAVYGSTEAEPIAHVSCRAAPARDSVVTEAGRGLLAGHPEPCVRLAILPDRWGRGLDPYTADEFARLGAPAGTPGEIVVSGAHVVPGYLHGHGDGETKVRAGGEIWHRTGDAGFLDGDGRLWLLGRCAARIDDARGTLYPFPVECAAVESPGVRRAAVVAHRGRRVLLVEPEGGAEGPDLPALERRVAWAGIDAVKLCPRIPVDERHNAKVDYPALRRLLSVQ